MRKTIVYFIMCLLALSVVFAASVSRELPRRADPNSDATIKLQVSGADSSGVLAIEEELPAGIAVKSWSVTGAVEAKDKITIREKDNRFGWSFTPSGSSATVEYKIKVGSSDVALGALVYFDKAGQGKADPQTLKVAPITCGDGICEGSENSDSCAADCPKAAPPAPVTPPAAAKGAAEVTKKTPVTGIIIAAIVIVVGIIIYLIARKKKTA